MSLVKAVNHQRQITNMPLDYSKTHSGTQMTDDAVHMHKHMFIDYDLMFSCCVVQYYKSTVRRFQTITFNMKLIRIKN